MNLRPLLQSCNQLLFGQGAGIHCGDTSPVCHMMLMWLVTYESWCGDVGGREGATTPLLYKHCQFHGNLLELEMLVSVDPFNACVVTIEMEFKVHHIGH